MARAGKWKGWKVEQHSLVVRGRPRKAAPWPRLRRQHRFQPRLDRRPIRRPRRGLEGGLLQIETAQYQALIARFGQRDVTKHLSVSCGRLPLCVTRRHFGFHCRAVSGCTGRQQRAHRSCNLDAEIRTDPVETRLQAAAEAVARGHADLANPAVLQHAQYAAQHEQPGYEEPGECRAPPMLADAFHHTKCRVFTLRLSGLNPPPSAGKESIKDVKLCAPESNLAGPTGTFPSGQYDCHKNLSIFHALAAACCHRVRSDGLGISRHRDHQRTTRSRRHRYGHSG